MGTGRFHGNDFDRIRRHDHCHVEVRAREDHLRLCQPRALPLHYVKPCHTTVRLSLSKGEANRGALARL